MENSQHKKLIINYLPSEFTAKELQSLFTTIGPVKYCNIVKNPKTGISVGYGFLTFVNPDDSETAIEKLNGLEMFGKQFKVSYARPPSRDKCTNLYITHLPSDVTEDDLEQMFGKFGDIVSKKILVEKATGFSRGIGFVRFMTQKSASEAIKEMNGKILGEHPRPIKVQVAKRIDNKKMVTEGTKKNQKDEQEKMPNRQCNCEEPNNAMQNPMIFRNTGPPAFNCRNQSNPKYSYLRSRKIEPTAINELMQLPEIQEHQPLPVVNHLPNGLNEMPQMLGCQGPQPQPPPTQFCGIGIKGCCGGTWWVSTCANNSRN